MKVTFGCGKCGLVLLSYNADQHNPMHDLSTGDNLSLVVAQLTCPNCAKLTYGPLTEEMVAAALEEADMVADDRDGYKQMTRFVLRLLKYSEELTRKVLCPSTPDEWRDWLLDLAREK